MLFILILHLFFRLSHTHILCANFMILHFNIIIECLRSDFMGHESPAHFVILHPPNTVNWLFLKVCHFRRDKVSKMLKSKYQFALVCTWNYELLFLMFCLFVFFCIFSCPNFISLNTFITIENINALMDR